MGVTDDGVWAVIGMANRLKRITDAMHQAAVDGKHVVVYADGQLIADLALDYSREQHTLPPEKGWHGAPT
jgi:hypothetical protein